MTRITIELAWTDEANGPGTGGQRLGHKAWVRMAVEGAALPPHYKPVEGWHPVHVHPPPLTLVEEVELAVLRCCDAGGAS